MKIKHLFVSILLATGFQPMIAPVSYTHLTLPTKLEV